MPEERFAPSQNQVPVEPQPSDKKSKYLLLLAVGLLLVSVGSGFTYWYLTKIPNPKSQISKPQATPEVAPTTPVVEEGVAEGRVFYSKDENIFSYDVATKTEEKWTNYPDDDGYSLRDIKVIDKDTLGFGKCDTVTGDFGCGLYLLDLRTKVVTQRVELGEDDHLLKSGWSDKDTLAYLVSSGDRWRLYLTNNDNTRLLVDLSTEGYGRGGFVEDSSEIEFSPDGSRFFHIATSSPRSPTDFATHVYDASTGEEVVVIENSTQPEWLDNQRIISRKYDADASAENGLYIYTIGSGAETKFVGAPTTAYRPELLSRTNKVLYEDNASNQLWLYNLSLEENTLVVENALFGFWLSPTQIVYSGVTSCGAECGMVDYEVQSIDIYDLGLGQKVGSIPSLQDTYNASSLYR